MKYCFKYLIGLKYCLGLLSMIVSKWYLLLCMFSFHLQQELSKYKVGFTRFKGLDVENFKYLL